jgi:hypothetical protein
MADYPSTDLSKGAQTLLFQYLVALKEGKGIMLSSNSIQSCIKRRERGIILS